MEGTGTDIYIGLQLSAAGAQLTWFHKGLAEPQTLSLPGERADGCLDVPPEVWESIGGDGPDARPSGGKDERGAHSKGDGGSAAAEYIRRLLADVPGRIDPARCAVCVTLPALGADTGDRVLAVMEAAGFRQRAVFFQDWRTSFYYYAVSKRKELWNGDVAFLTHRDEKIIGYILHIDRTSRPATASILHAGEEDVSEKVRAGRSDEEWDREKDRLFYELLGRMFERRNVSASYLYGPWFSASWARRSFQYLTWHRHAFQGQNLFSKGACYGAMAREGRLAMPDILFLGTDMVRENWGVRENVQGRLKYIPMISAGVNWYEAASSLEFILDERKSAYVLSSRDDGSGTREHVLRLDHFPERPPRASRVRLSVWYSAPGRCEIEAADLGFGALYPSSGKVWHRTVRISEENEDQRPDADGSGSL